MKWVIKENDGTQKVWYSGDVIEKIKNSMTEVLYADQCNNCDGCGYESGCADTNCGTYQANIVMNLIESEDK